MPTCPATNDSTRQASPPFALVVLTAACTPDAVTRRRHLVSPAQPITPQPGTSVISVCGKIFNEGGAIYTGGGIYVSDALGDSFATLIASSPVRSRTTRVAAVALAASAVPARRAAQADPNSALRAD